MTLKLRSRLRPIVATTICALIAAPALVAGTTTTAGAAPPGINSATLTVNGQGTGVASGLGTNTWHFDGSGYTELQAALENTQNFGPNGTFKKGQYTVPRDVDHRTVALPRQSVEPRRFLRRPPHIGV